MTQPSDQDNTPHRRVGRLDALRQVTALFPGLRAAAIYGQARRAVRAGRMADALAAGTEALAVAGGVPTGSPSRPVAAAVAIQATLLLSDLGRVLPEPAVTRQDLLKALDLCLEARQSHPRRAAKLKRVEDELRQRIAGSDAAVLN